MPTIIVQELRFHDARSRTVIGQLSKKRLTSSAFFLTVELFSKIFSRSVREKKAPREAFKKTPGAFSKSALLHRNIMPSAGRKKTARCEHALRGEVDMSARTQDN